MSWFGLVKFITGVMLAIALLFVAGGAAARYLMTRLSALPPKPVFPEEQSTANSDDNPPASSPTESTATPQQQDPSTVSAPEPTDAESLPEGAYRARIAQPIGMVLRQGPSTETTRIGGIDYNEPVIILSESNDGEWQNVRLPGSGVEGWIKAGNIERLGE